METKSIDRVELKTGASGEFEALISTFNKPDKYGDVTRRGTFRDTIAAWRAAGAKVPVIYSHRSEDINQHIGEVDPRDLQETDRGLVARGRLYLEEAIPLKVFKQLQRRALREWSFRFRVLRSAPSDTGRELQAVELIELGPCLSGAGDTQTIAVKSDEGLTVDEARRQMTATALAPYRAELDRASRRMALQIARGQ